MKVKELIEQLQKLPPEENITIDGEPFHLEAIWQEYSEEYKCMIHTHEIDMDYVNEHRAEMPGEIEYILREDDEEYTNYISGA